MTDAQKIAAELRAEALLEYYMAERRNGVDVLEANRRMMEFAKRFDELPQPTERVA